MSSREQPDTLTPAAAPSVAGAASVARTPVSRRRRWVFIAAAFLIAIIVPVGALAVIDIYLHTRFQRTGGVNVWGYRGPIAARKRSGEKRVVMLGGSSAFGYGVSWSEAIPARLETKLREAGQRASVVNLAYNNEGAYSFKFTLDDYQYLDYDLALLYEGYNDLMGDPRGPNLSVFRHGSQRIIRGTRSPPSVWTTVSTAHRSNCWAGVRTSSAPSRCTTTFSDIWRPDARTRSLSTRPS